MQDSDQLDGVGQAEKARLTVIVEAIDDEDSPCGQEDAKKRGDKEIQRLREAIGERSTPALAFYFLDYMLRSQTVLFDQIYGRKDLYRVSLALALLSTCLIGIYGATMGIYNGWRQALASAVKLPCLFLLTGVICIPSLYVFNVLLGQRFRFMQTVSLFAAAIGTTSILLGSLAPVAIFFTITGSSYSFMKLLHVSALGLCGIYGALFLYRGCSHVAERGGMRVQKWLMVAWMGLYGTVGMQLGWRLRPFLGDWLRPFELFRPVESNFYLAVLDAVLGILR